MFRIEDKNNITVEFNSQKGGAAGVRNNAPLIFISKWGKKIFIQYTLFKKVFEDPIFSKAKVVQESR